MEKIEGRKRATLADVARLAGLSQTAASMILTGRPDTRLSAEAHARVMEAAEKLGYRPNVAARSLRTDRTQSIAFISDVVATTRFAMGLIRGALDAATAAKHVMLVLETGGEPARESEAIAVALDRQVDGIIFAAMRAREVFVPDLDIHTKVVMLNATNPRFGVSVLPDEQEGGRAAVELLRKAGRREGIALLGQSDAAEAGLFRSETVSRRVLGIRAEMKRRNLGFVAEESCWNWEPEEGYRLAKRILKRDRNVRALLCMNDRLAFGAYQALAELGLNIPEDVCLVSFDNDEIAAYLRPGLTTISLPHEEMGRLSVELLLGGGVDGENLVKMPIVERGSLPVPIKPDVTRRNRRGTSTATEG
ncbi:MAG: LacI family DNA-binding transcriptional regulator [Devosia sp.]